MLNNGPASVVRGRRSVRFDSRGSSSHGRRSRATIGAWSPLTGTMRAITRSRSAVPRFGRHEGYCLWNTSQALVLLKPPKSHHLTANGIGPPPHPSLKSKTSHHPGGAIYYHSPPTPPKHKQTATNAPGHLTQGGILIDKKQEPPRRPQTPPSQPQSGVPTHRAAVPPAAVGQVSAKKPSNQPTPPNTPTLKNPPKPPPQNPPPTPCWTPKPSPPSPPPTSTRCPNTNRKQIKTQTYTQTPRVPHHTLYTPHSNLPSLTYESLNQGL